MSTREAQIRALLFLYTETPLHVGSSAGLGAIDLPIQRERWSRLPVVPGSGLRGALREAVRDARLAGALSEALEWALFGPPPPGKDGPDASDARPSPSDFGGALSLLDGRLLLLPVRTARAGWAWATSPLILQRLARDLEMLGTDRPAWANIAVDEEHCKIAPRSRVVLDRSVIIEDQEFPATEDTDVAALAEWLKDALPGSPAYEPYRSRLAGQLVVLSDTDLTDLAEHAIEIATRIRIDPETGTVADGALWTEEALPSETLLWSAALISQDRSATFRGGTSFEVRDFIRVLSGPEMASRLRLGGDQGTGRGLVSLRWREGR